VGNYSRKTNEARIDAANVNEKTESAQFSLRI
jgi:hypothetical protein